ncbi:MAG: ATP-dependent zinc metalloprotease FtsH [Bacteroidaceae bacterium]|nr:ATP-dependent zinc metalloprotease FtsH [Bacteroidaceae bacterium]
MANQKEKKPRLFSSKSPKNGTGAGKNPKTPGFSLSWVYIIIIGVLAYMLYTGQSSSGGIDKEVSLTEFQRYVMTGYTRKVVANTSENTVSLIVKPDSIRSVFGMGTDRTGKEPTITANYATSESVEALVLKARESGQPVSLTYKKGNGMLWNLLMSLLPIVVLVALWMFVLRRMGGGMGGGIMGVGKSRAKLFEKGQNSTGITFKDVAGQEGAKQEVQEIVEFLKNPKKYTDLGGKIPKGALLVGPPGTGKTLLAKAVAGEADVPFFSLAGSDFVEMFVGVGASRVRDLFRQAKEKAPSIIFIDEIDAIGRARGSHLATGANDERESTLNQLLTEMDGFDTNSGVIIMAATNRVEILDKALLRAGRFDRQIHVDLPDMKERRAIFEVHLKPIKLGGDIDIDFLARQTPGFSGADIANVCNEAALIAARYDHPAVVKQDFLDAVDRIIGGLEKKSKVMTADEKHAIAIHEAGHASVSWLTRYGNPLVKVTIVPRGQALGAAWYLPEERTITLKEQMLDELCSLLAGRAAEEIFTGHISSGALSDIERATKLAFSMVAYYGMSDALPNLCYYTNEQYSFNKPYGDKTAALIDSEVQRIIAEQYVRAKQILSDNKEGHNKLAAMLEEREVIFTEDVEGIFGKRPWISRVEELMRDEQAETEGDNATSPDAVTSVSSDVETEHHDETAEQTKS